MENHLWKEIYGIGIEEVDSQHQALLKCLNECVQETAFPQGVKNDVDMYILLNEVNTHADTHFKTEEKLMQSVNYPDFEMHQHQHRLFKEQVEQLVRAVSSGEKPVIAYLAAFLRNWYMRHILVHDKRIEAYMLCQR